MKVAPAQLNFLPQPASRISRWALLALLAALALAPGVFPGCHVQQAPQQATLALVGDFRGFQRPCG